MKKLLVRISLLLVSNAAHSQITFEKTLSYTGSSFSVVSIVQEPDSGFTFLVNQEFSLNKPLIVKTDKQGSVQWTKGYLAGMQIANSLIKTKDGGYLIAGRSAPVGNVYQAQILKLDNSANLVWSKQYQNTSYNTARALQVADSGYVLYGTTGNASFFLKLNPSGAVQWENAVSYNGNGLVTDVSENPDQSLVLAGTVTIGNQYQSFLAKASAAGTLLWTKKFESNSPPYFNKVLPTHDNGFLVSGIFWEANHRSILLKTDSSANLLWNKVYENVQAGSLTKETGPEYCLYGINNDRDTADAALIRINSAGDTIWTHTYGLDSLDWEEPNDAIRTLDNGFLLAGRRAGFISGRQAGYLVKTDALGKTFCSNQPAIVLSQAAYIVTNILLQGATGFTSGTVTGNVVSDPLIDSVACGPFLSIPERPEEISFSIYPNPSSGFVTILLPDPGSCKKLQLVVYNGIDQEVARFSGQVLAGKKQLKIRTDEWDTGIYYVVLLCDGRRVKVKKLLRVRD